MDIKDSVVLVTGANRGLGKAFARELVARGAKKVYGAARNPSTISDAGVIPVALDVNNASRIEELATTLSDVTIIINNAGIAKGVSILSDECEQALAEEMATNFYGPLRLSRAFAPVLKKNGGGAILNVLSVLSWLNIKEVATYSVTKAAAWSLTNALRGELQGQGTQVVGLHVGYMDTDMASHIDAPKVSPDLVASRTLDVIQAGGSEVLADELTQQIKAVLSNEVSPYLNLGS